ncbi:hypothetical protein OIU79_009277 [Salix purpurea]|uniref:Uncharacterized protein n=1 Tax=Salix purpurea TaxID=77065 RepID=A0A9Q0YX24_SALPP|nr:hypothetical protein OIU79_009277 [Salix purpurea]
MGSRPRPFFLLPTKTNIYASIPFIPVISYTLYNTHTAWSNRFPVTDIFPQFHPLTHFEYIFNLKICRISSPQPWQTKECNPHFSISMNRGDYASRIRLSPSPAPSRLRQSRSKPNMLPNFKTRYLFNICVVSNPSSFTETTSQF